MSSTIVALRSENEGEFEATHLTDFKCLMEISYSVPLIHCLNL